jgi:hypothetical protein
MLKQFSVLLCLVLIMGCGQRSAVKIDDRGTVAKCIASRRGRSDYVLLTRCVPLSRPMRLEGTWFVGFEESAFNAGYSRVPAISDNGGIPLVYSDTAAKSLPTVGDGQRAAYRIAFIGRRTLIGEPILQRIIVDTVISIKEVPRLPNATEKGANSNIQQ